MPAEIAGPVLHLQGEVDMLVAESFLNQGRELLAGAAPGGTLVVDLTDVTFLDSAGLNMLVRLRLDAIADGKQLVLCNVPERVTELLRITGLVDVLTLA